MSDSWEYEYGTSRLGDTLNTLQYFGEATNIMVKKIQELVDYKPEKAASIVVSLMHNNTGR